MNTLAAYRRADGQVGVRNHLFTLPAVVCANQVAIDVARRLPRLKYIEHQHGCAQIGADLLQTRRVFSRLALHPNVYASMFVSLGCEAVVAKKLFEDTRKNAQKPLELVVIQDAGGTLAAEQQVEAWLQQRIQEADALVRETVAWSDITVGVMGDGDLTGRGPVLTSILQALSDLGARLVVPARHADALRRVAGDAPHTAWGDGSDAQAWVMEEGSNALETATGLTAAGAHLIVHLADRPHGFGTPLAPVVRWSVNEQVYNRFYDDFDGQLVDELDVPRLMEQLSRVISGQETAAEQMGMDDFALYRIGPTV
ncbi:MAG: UxaA family hydrolase [Alicyclobacillus macrosporangiidus]|uniref:UxaA family hydrolase n=1 Tax=Alicyclobacillus macrosporangiidus TaxID=392015 RepID=UPI0026EF81BE|nr:UxaA family hydrolase [Alicyclobacillus macrosporangiidus]MCL6599472.1 UxaA family hydrolase [Alicyclobacillus macrosporangiidus]